MANRTTKEMLKAAARAEKTDVFAAIDLYYSVLKDFPAHKAARQGIRNLQLIRSRQPNAEPPVLQIQRLNDLIAQGHTKQAIAETEATLRDFPYSVSTQLVFADICLLEGDLESAEYFLRTALGMSPSMEKATLVYCDVLEKLRRPEEALHALAKLESQGSARKTLQAEMGAFARSLGDKERAEKHFSAAFSAAPDNAGLFLNLVSASQGEVTDTQVSTGLRLVDLHNNNLAELRHAHLSLATLRFRQSKKADGFAHLSLSKTADTAARGYRFEADQAHFEDVRKYFEGMKTFTNTSEKEGSDKPIFVVGMPRSGTSLMEQILAANNHVTPLGELGVMEALCRAELQSPKGKHYAEAFDSIGSRYLREAKMRLPETPFFVDKMPMNFRYIGFILEAMPEAKVIYMDRAAEAVCWSIMTRYFPNLDFSSGLASICQYYKQHEQMMDFWSERYGSKFLKVSYDALVADPEPYIREVVQFCGLSWDKRYLAHHKNTGSVNTASALQVRQPIYKGSSEKWRDYEEFLAPIFEEYLY
ncbi:MAG: sulfotransferase [Pseudomonadota bacterium]